MQHTDDHRSTSESDFCGSDEEELEYSVQFAGRNPSDKDFDASDDDDDDAEEIDSVVREKEPVVFIIGWAGCMDKHLTKYSDLYVRAGVTAIRFKPQFRKYFITVDDVAGLRKQAQKLIEIISDLGLESHPIFFHVFSNNGIAFYSEVVDIIMKWTELDCPIVCGAVLDSCPGRPHCMTLLRYSIQSSTLDELSPFQTFLRILCTFFFAIISPLTKVLFGWQSLTRLANRERVEHWPIYYIYSGSDKLVPFTDVELSIRIRSANGLPVGSHRFTDSVHVAHYQKYPEEYAKHCLTFMRNCLSQ